MHTYFQSCVSLGLNNVQVITLCQVFPWLYTFTSSHFILKLLSPFECIMNQSDYGVSFEAFLIPTVLMVVQNSLIFLTFSVTLNFMPETLYYFYTEL